MKDLTSRTVDVYKQTSWDGDELKRLITDACMKVYVEENVVVYPEPDNVFRALKMPTEPKVIIVGQDPYHNGNADGLAFSCKEKVSPSLRVILKSLELPYENGKPYTLEHWQEAGIVLLNTALTVEESKPKSHSDMWRLVTTKMIEGICTLYPDVIVMRWGKDAQSIPLPENITTLDTCHPMATIYGKHEFNPQWEKLPKQVFDKIQNQ